MGDLGQARGGGVVGALQLRADAADLQPPERGHRRARLLQRIRQRPRDRDHAAPGSAAAAGLTEVSHALERLPSEQDPRTLVSLYVDAGRLLHEIDPAAGAHTGAV